MYICALSLSWHDSLALQLKVLGFAIVWPYHGYHYFTYELRLTICYLNSLIFFVNFFFFLVYKLSVTLLKLMIVWIKFEKEQLHQCILNYIFTCGTNCTHSSSSPYAPFPQKNIWKSLESLIKIWLLSTLSYFKK